MKINKCPACGSASFIEENGELKCKYCGSVIEDERKKDRQEIDKLHEMIESIKKKEQDLEENNNKKIQEFKENEVNRQTTYIIIKLIVCAFLGWLGIHKFLENKIVLGFVYMFTVGVFGVGIIYDIVKYIWQITKLRLGGKD